VHPSDLSRRIPRFDAFSHVCERFANESGRDAEALCDERVKHRPEGGQDTRLARVDQHPKRSPDGEAPLVCHLATSPLVDEQEICLDCFRDENGCGFSGIQPKVHFGRWIVNDPQP